MFSAVRGVPKTSGLQFIQDIAPFVQYDKIRVSTYYILVLEISVSVWFPQLRTTKNSSYRN